MKKSFSLTVLVLMLIAVLSACGGGGGGGGGATLVSLAVTPASPSIAKGTTQQFTATGTYSDNTTQDLTASATWSSSDTAVATINSAGLAASVAVGSTTITATSGGILGTATLTVTNATLASIAVTPANPSIVLGTTQQFTATGTFSDSTTQDLTTQVTWSSSDTGKATINSAGLATSVAVGTTTITAASGSISGSTTLTIATLSSIAVTPANAGIVRSATQQFTATGTLSNSATKNLTTQAIWSSTTTTVATISTGGMATPISAGTTTITAVYGSISGNTTLTVQGVNLAKTGQTVCYDAAGAVIACSSTGQDGDLQKGAAWPDPRFTDNGDGTVTDNLTGLMWLKNANCIQTQYPAFDGGAATGDGTAGDGKVTWQHAIDFVAGINAGTYPNCGGGHADWRMPNRKEHRSLADYSKYNPVLPAGYPFTNVADYYWSSSTYADSTISAWAFAMINYASTSFKTTDYYVWPVRSAPADIPKTGQATSYDANTVKADDGALQMGVAWPDPRFTVGAGAEVDCVTDNLTGLMWVKAPDSTLRIWQAALDYANGLSLCGHSDWRLPNVNEMESLVHAEYTKETACGGSCSTNAAWLNTQGFSNVRADPYWSSTMYAGNTAYAWFVNMSDDGVAPNHKTLNSRYVWPVRSGQ